MVDTETKRCKLIDAVCLYGNEVESGSEFDNILLKYIGPFNPKFDVKKIYCHAVTPDNKLIVSDIKQRSFFIISGGWGTIGKTLCGIECTDFYDFQKDYVSSSEIRNELLLLENRLNKNNGFASTMVLHHKIEFLKTIADILGCCK